MKKYISNPKFSGMKRNIITALLVMIASNFTIAQLSAEIVAYFQKDNTNADSAKEAVCAS